MKITTRKLKPFPPNSNPFHHDAVHMGTAFGKNLMLMHSNHATEQCKYFVAINTETGERTMVTFNQPRFHLLREICRLAYSIVMHKGITLKEHLVFFVRCNLNYRPLYNRWWEY